MDNESTQMEEANVFERIIYHVGDVKKVRKECLSVLRVFPATHNLKHLATLALFYGDCSLNSLGCINHECQLCGAHLWKSEAIHTSNGCVGKYCCSHGKVSLLPLVSPPTTLRDLLHGDDIKSKSFRKNIRAYNNSLAFVSLGAQIDDRFSRGGGVYTFRVHGTTYHRVGTLLPDGTRGQQPQFAQLYVYDTEHELQNRLQRMPSLDAQVMESLQSMMHAFNPYANACRSIREMLQDNPHVELKMVISESRSTSRQYLVPTGTEVAAIMPGQGEDSDVGHRDIQIFCQNGAMRRISNLHRSYMPLLYVLLFPNGEDGWDCKISCRRIEGGQSFYDNTNFVTQRQYYAFRLQIRGDTRVCLLRGGRLLQQYIVDAYSGIEEARLVWIHNNQASLRSDVYQGLTDMVNLHDGAQVVTGNAVGRRVLLPSSYTGGPRFMHQLYQDSMAIVRKKGKPDLFITFTCNPRWEEISNALLPGQTAQDRPDLTARVFYQKHRDMMHLLVKKSLFGEVVGFVSVIEFQKRGLPHAHILLILKNEYKPSNVCHYDRLVCAEFPDKDMFPELHDIISHCNIHGPCGPFNSRAACMIDGKCKHRYPRKFSNSTVMDENGYPAYMRRDDGSKIKVKGDTLDCRWVVPYNPFLSMRYKAHINVEICSTITAVKYLYKYVYKGHDRATIRMQDMSGGVIDEVSSYLDARYVSASEACWRIFEYKLHEEKPDIQRLQVHLPNQNTIMFRDCDDLRHVVNADRNRKTTLTGWFIANQQHEDAHELLYIDFPIKWVWNKASKLWTRRKQGNTIGRMYNVSPSAGEQYFLRVLLTVCKGCKSFEDVRTFDGQVYPTFKAACLARGLLETDEEWFTCLQEAAFHSTGYQLRKLFVVILVFCEPVYPGHLWERFLLELSEDFIHVWQSRGCDGNACKSLAENDALLSIENLLQQHGKRLIDFDGIPLPNRPIMNTINNGLLMEEMIFDASEQAELAMGMEESLNECQRIAFDTILGAVHNDFGGAFFLDGPGGSGKTYLYNALLARLRGDNHIALACASSGIAALLLANGRTTHSRFKIPLVLNASSTCSVKVNSALAEVLKLTKLIIWDEAPMTHRHAFEALNRTLQDIMQNDKVFGGKVMLLGGDFRQVLPVVRKGGREDIVDATLCRSKIWRDVTVLKLTQNMRILHSASDSRERDFCKWVLDVGNGALEIGGVEDLVELPQEMVLEKGSLPNLIEWVYRDLPRQQENASFFKDRAILAPRNQEVDDINEIALNAMYGNSREFLSADSINPSTQNSLLYTTEYLNSLNLGGGYPPHRLVLKVNAPIILLRNLDPRRGLCNGTRLVCKYFHAKVIEAEIITGTNIGDRVFLPRITFIPTALDFPFEMRRRQFPVKLAFGMTINKSQGQTLSILGLYLATPVFTHGQFYVAMSRVRCSKGVKIYVKHNKDCEGENAPAATICTTNVVYKEVLQMAMIKMANYLSFTVPSNEIVRDPHVWDAPLHAQEVVDVVQCAAYKGEILNEPVFGMLLVVTNRMLRGHKFQFLGYFMGDVLPSADGTQLHVHLSYLGLRALDGWKYVIGGVFEDITYWMMAPIKKQRIDEGQITKRIKVMDTCSL